jgi:hypothetical protein
MQGLRNGVYVDSEGAAPYGGARSEEFSSSELL